MSHYKEKKTFCVCLVLNFRSPLPAKAVRSVWCYLFGVTQKSIWMEMGEFPLVSVTPVCKDREHTRCIQSNNISQPFSPHCAIR